MSNQRGYAAHAACPIGLSSRERGQMMTNRELLHCESCDRDFTRERTRGRKPKVCGQCRPSVRVVKDETRTSDTEVLPALTPDEIAERLTVRMRERQRQDAVRLREHREAWIRRVRAC